MLTHLAIGFVVSTLSAAGVLLIKAAFRKRLSARGHYRLWFLFMAALMIPFIPADAVDVGWRMPEFDAAASAGGSVAAVGSAAPEAGASNWLEDAAISVRRSIPGFLAPLATGVWLGGLLAFAALVGISMIKTRAIRRSSRRATNAETVRLLERCKRLAGISKDVVLSESPFVQSPVMFGLFRTHIVFPSGFAEWLEAKEIEFILLHELHHVKVKDHWTNYAIVALQLIYWFNPFVWAAFSRMRTDRELACDAAVLSRLDERRRAEYGDTILRFAGRARPPIRFAAVSPLAGSKDQIRRRIEQIASFRAESGRSRASGVAAFALACAFLAGQLPLASALAAGDDRYAFDSERAVTEDWSDHFAGYEGSFVFYDPQADRYHIYNEPLSVSRVSPNSTYKIYGALFGLDASAISPEQSALEWNGEASPYEAWNRDHDVFTAMRASANWYFREVDRRVGRDRLQAYMERIGYGNADTSGGTEPFWLESSLRVSPVEQVQTLRALYTNRWGFEERHIQTVKDAIKLERRGEAELSGKTGTGAIDGRDVNGWFVGYVEKNGNTYFFATNIRGNDRATGSAAARITLSILKDKGIYS